MWKPISIAEFEKLFIEEKSNLPDVALQAFERFALPISTAKIRRSEQYDDEEVFVVAKSPKGVIYFDDVEWGFNFSPIDSRGHILEHGASQMNLADAVESWLVPQLN